MQTNFAKPLARTQSYTKFSTPLVLEPPLHCGLPTIRLGLGKHLLGTDGSCTVRVRADNVEPRHAMIVVSEHRTVVKALHPQTWVNEGPVSETALRPGDRLSLGPLTFRVRAARADELQGFQEANAGTFQAEDSFPNDDLMNRNRAVETAWRIDSSSNTARDLAAPLGTVASTYAPPMTSRDSAPVIPTITESVKHAEALALPEHSTAARDIGHVAKPKSWAEITVPVAIARVTPELPAVANELVPVAAQYQAAFADNASPIEALGHRISDNAKPAFNGTSSSSVTSTPALDLRLEEISRKLAELDRPIHQRSASNDRSTASDETAERVDSLAAERRHVSEQQVELQQRAEELARQTEQLQRQAARVCEREVDADRVQAQLTREHEELRLSTDATRRELDEEYARHQTLWQAWDTAYRRTSGELNEQLQSLEQRRTALATDTERLVLERSHVQRLLAEQERDRREIAVLQSQLANDHDSLKSWRTDFDIERQQHLDAIQEREAHIAAERRSAVTLQAELLLARQQFERDRTVFLTERASTATQHDRERFELIERREQLEHETTRLQDDRRELERLRQMAEADRTEFALERDALRSQLTELTTQMTVDRTELTLVREQLSRVQAELLQVQSEPSHAPSLVVAAPFAAGSIGANSVEVAQRERFVDPYANVDLPPLIVGRPFRQLVPAFDSHREPATLVLSSIAHTSPRVTDPMETVTIERFVDPYAEVQWPSPSEDFAVQTETDRVEDYQRQTESKVCSVPSLPPFATEATVVSELYAAGDSISASSFDRKADSGATGYRFWADSTLYETAHGLSSGETPMFHDSANERMGGSKFDSPAAVPAKIAASLTVDQPVPNAEGEYSSGDSIEIWSRSDASGEQISTNVGAAAELETCLETALATLEEPASIDKTLAEINREFGVNLPATEDYAFAPTMKAAAESQLVDQESRRPDPKEFKYSLFAAPPAATVAADEHCVEQDTASEVDGAVASTVDHNSLELVLARLQSMMAPKAVSDLPSSALRVPAELTAMLVSEQSDMRVAAEDKDEESSELTAVALPALELTSLETAVDDSSSEAHSSHAATAFEQQASNESTAEETQFTAFPQEEFIVPEVDDVAAESTAELQVGSASGLSQLPAWWKACESVEIPVYEGPHSEDDVADIAVAGLIAPAENVAEQEPQRTTEPEAAAANDPLASLRAQLAQLFDMKAEAPASPASELTAAASSLEEVASHETDTETIETSGELTESLIEATGSTSEVSAPADAAHEHQNSSEATASTVPIPEETSAGGIEEDDSVETYMAHLLSRARGGAVVSPKEVKALATSVASSTASSAAALGQLPDGEHVAFDPADRSHLKAEPKHKQDRQAVRDDLQSFRQLAHQSARSALARHTTKTLLGALIAKSMLFSVSAAATVFYLGAPLVGWPSEIWNGLACSLATVLSGIEFYRSWSKLRESRQHGLKPKPGNAARTAKSVATE